MRLHLNPGTVGISYEAAGRLLDALEELDTEPHALYVMRHGETVLEGYWAPYGPGVIHGCQSLTKTVTGIALGCALQEGILSLEDRLIDLFPEYAPLTEGSRWWEEVRVKHLATMSCGMDSQTSVTGRHWIRGFFETRIDHRPGTSYFYNSIACSMVGACIRKRTGEGLLQYLSERVFRKIGIDPAHLRWHCHADGMENGSGGFISTARDNALLMELYRRRGVWNNERILSKEWVDFALQVQNPHVGGDAQYGGMLWVREGCFVADGAMGQWSLLFPRQDLVISLNQTICRPDVDDAVRRAVCEFADSVTESKEEWTDRQRKRFAGRLERLCIPAPVCREDGDALAALSGRSLKIPEGSSHFFADDLTIFDLAYGAPVKGFSFRERMGELVLHVVTETGEADCNVAFHGYRPVQMIAPVTNNPARMASVTGSFPGERELRLEIRWLESCRVHLLTFRFDEEGADITTSRIPVGGFDVPDETVRAVWVKGER